MRRSILHMLSGPMRWVAGLALIVVQTAAAAPGDTLFSDDFESGFGQWTEVASGGDASIGTETDNSGTRSMRVRWGAVYAYTSTIAASVGSAELSAWIRRGSDSFSEDPDSGEDLVIEYRDAGFNWNVIDTFAGNGTPGEVYDATYPLPAGALHAGLRIRFRLTGGNGSDNDYWHVDDVLVTETGTVSTPQFSLDQCEDFESGFDGWTVTGTSSKVGVSTATASSPTNSLYTRFGGVTATSPAVDLSAQNAVDLALWIRRGDEPFSKKPEDDEDLVVEYLNGSGSWVALESFDGAGSAGQIYARSYTLPADALHADFRIRFRHVGSGEGYWHFDDACLGSGVPTLLFSFDESEWTGAAGEAEESNGTGVSGTPFGGATTATLDPALASNPGTCGYGVFDGVDDYIEVPDGALFDLTNELTIGAWIYMRSTPAELHTIVSKDWNYEFHIDQNRRVYWWWNDSTGTTRSFTTAASISLNEWHHVAITYESGSQVIYIDGAVAATQSYTGTLRVNDLPFYVGTDWNIIARAFDGYIDEVYLIPQAYSQAEVQALRDARHDCGTANAQFTINHDGYGIHCAAEAVSVDVIDASAGTPLINYNAEIVLDTQTGSGTWSLVSGSGAFSDGAADDGVASYDWPLGESAAVFALSYTHGTSVMDIDAVQVTDNGIRDTDAEGLLSFSPSGFVVTASPLANPPPGTIAPFAAAQTAAVPFDVYITAYGQTPTDPTCGVIESYTGNQSIKFWSAYDNPSTGFYPVEVDGAAVATSEGAAASQVVAFTNGQAQVVAEYDDVGSIQLALKDDTVVHADLPTGIRGATAAFVAKPASFVLSDIRNGAGTLSNPGASDASGPVFVAAGTDFRATVTAINADGDATPNYGRESSPEAVRLEVELVAPAGGQSPAVTAASGFAIFASGSATATDLRWDEVGIVRLRPAVGDGDYLGAGDVSGDLSGNVGRFVPNHFSLAFNSPLFATACVAGGYTYVGEPFQYMVAPVVTATAMSAAGTPTLNYTSAFFKMSSATLANRIYAATTGTLDMSGLPLGSADPSVTESAPGIATLTFSSGTGLSFGRVSEVAPFDADISVSIDVLDGDGVAGAGNPATFTSIPFSGGREQRYGRVRFTNAVGSELVALPVMLAAEYFAGVATGYVVNTDDVCSNDVTVTLGGYTENLSVGDTCVLDAGFPGSSGAGCAVAAPPAQQFSSPPTAGSFNLMLAAPGATNTGSVSLEANVPAWLTFDWDAALPGSENPTAQATFGLFGGDDAQIYLRELF